MAFVQNFTSSESIGIPSQITLVDTSTGTDLTLTNRQITLRLANGNYLGTLGESTSPVQINWPIADSSITLDILPNSLTPIVTVDWMAGSSVAYTKSVLTCFDLFDYVFGLNQLSNQTSSPQILADTNYFSNFLKLIVNIFNAENAVLKGDDQYSSQGSLNLNLFLIQNENDFF